ncbi:protein phosphatase 2C domain-containing protein [Streptomyces sp. NPDC048290]|uniref:protein phosphatase 2C domain-containing protein n=1 Tax=Streptomyces sp. NPDC048290 TaxID=3155811 RepID=UPI0034187FE4
MLRRRKKEQRPGPDDPSGPSEPADSAGAPESGGRGEPEVSPASRAAGFTVSEYEVKPFQVPPYDGPPLEEEYRADRGGGQRADPERERGRRAGADGPRHRADPPDARDRYERDALPTRRPRPVTPPDPSPSYDPDRPRDSAPPYPTRRPFAPDPAWDPPPPVSSLTPSAAAGAPTRAPRHAAPRTGEPEPPRPPGDGRTPDAPPTRTTRWRRFVLGTAAPRVEPKPPPADPYRPDTFFDGWSTSRLTVRLASVRGDQHRFGGVPRQDDAVVAWHEPTGTVVFAVADGVSAAPLSHIGATLACRTAVGDLLAQLDEDRSEPDWPRVLQAAAYQLLMRVAAGREPGERERAEAARTLATTLVAGTVAPRRDGDLQVTLVRAGDSSAWCLRAGDYAPLFRDTDGDTESGGISSTAVVALPRLSGRPRPISYTLPGDSVLLVGTDGFGVPLGDGTGMVGAHFAQHLAEPPEPRGLAHLLDFSRETFDDDRTLLAVWRRPRRPGGGPR